MKNASILLVFLLLGQLSFGQLTFANQIAHFVPNPIVSGTPWPTTYGGQTEIIESSPGPIYRTVGTATDDITVGSNPVVGAFDPGFGHSWLHKILIPGTDLLNGMQLCIGNNEEVFVGAMDYQTATQTLHKYLIKLDSQSNPLWALDLGPGTIRSMIYDNIDYKVMVHGEQDNQLYLSSIDATSGAMDWGFTYSGTPVDNRHIAGEVLIDPADEQLVMVGTGVDGNGRSDILVFKIDRTTGIADWGRRYKRQAPVFNESAIAACFHPGMNGMPSLTIVGRTTNNVVLTLNINPATTLNGPGIINWQRRHRSPSWTFNVQRIAYNPISKKLFVVGGARSTGGFSQGFVMPIDPASGQGLGTFGVWATSYSQTSFPGDGDCIFRDIDVHSQTYAGEMRLTGNALLSNNSVSGANPGLWFAGATLDGIDDEAGCANQVPFTTMNYNMNFIDGKNQIDLPIPPFVPVYIAAMNAPTLDDCSYSFRYHQDNPLPKESVVFNVYPNPTSEKLTIQMAEVPDDLQVVLMDAFGKLVTVPVVRNEQGFTVDVSNLSSGVYFLHSNGVETRFTQKVLVE
ncbi:MAG: T9SS type A sorting domain-containing protein [Salibacteraceae bacterium]